MNPFALLVHVSFNVALHTKLFTTFWLQGRKHKSLNFCLYYIEWIIDSQSIVWTSLTSCSRIAFFKNIAAILLFWSDFVRYHDLLKKKLPASISDIEFGLFQKIGSGKVLIIFQSVMKVSTCWSDKYKCDYYSFSYNSLDFHRSLMPESTAKPNANLERPLLRQPNTFVIRIEIWSAKSCEVDTFTTRRFNYIFCRRSSGFATWNKIGAGQIASNYSCDDIIERTSATPILSSYDTPHKVAEWPICLDTQEYVKVKFNLDCAYSILSLLIRSSCSSTKEVVK